MRYVTLLAVVFLGGRAYPAPSSVNFTSVHYPGATLTTAANGINSGGQIVGQYSSAGVISASFLLSGGNYTEVAVPGSNQTAANGINTGGDIVGSDLSGKTGFVLSQWFTGALSYPGALSTQAFGINDQRQVVGSYGDSAGVTHGFLYSYSGSSYITLDFPGSTSTTATGINNSGQIVGWFQDSAGTHGFLYSAGSYTTLDAPGATSTWAFGINNSGQIAGEGGTDPTYYGFVYSAGAYNQFNIASAPLTAARGINDSGQVVGSYGGGGVENGFLTTAADVLGAPAAPVLTSPANSATGTALTLTLSWTASTGATSYDVYFGTQSSPPLAGNTTGSSFAVGPLSGATQYFWQVVAKGAGGTAGSGVWSFTTGAAQPVVALRFVPVTPCRVADTRGAIGLFGGLSMAAVTARSFPVPQSGCGIPASAQAYSLNVTVVPHGALSYLTLWPTGQAQPGVSTLNSWGGAVVANAAIVAAGVNGAVSVYASDATDVILDINGYFDTSAGATSYAFYPVTPCRAVDTRNPVGPFGGPAMLGPVSRDFPLPQSVCAPPATSRAYSLNVTVVPKPLGQFLAYLTTWPAGQTQPGVSTLNSWEGTVVANAAIVPAGTGESISAFVTNPTDVILDLNGYFAAPGSGGALTFYPVAPCRVADTRNAAGDFGGPEMTAQTTRTFTIPASGCNIPSSAAAYSLNITVVPGGPLQYLTAWPAGEARPGVSTLNSWDGAVAANAAIVPAGTSGAISVFVTDTTQVILDINGYFAP